MHSLSTVASCTILSISSVVTPGVIAAAASSSTSQRLELCLVQLPDVGVSFQLHLRHWVTLWVWSIVWPWDVVRHNPGVGLCCGSQPPCKVVPWPRVEQPTSLLTGLTGRVSLGQLVEGLV